MIKLIKRIFNIFRYEDMHSGYIWISIMGIIIRYIALGYLCKSLILNLGITYGILISIGATIVNWFIEYPLYKFTYLETGIFYEYGNASLGSFLYLLFYLINCGLIFIIRWFWYSNIYYICIASYILCVLIIRGIVALKRNFA